LSFLFAWSGRNMSAHQKLAAYPHLYSFTSTKSVVHWFQIIRNKTFQMYDDDASNAFSIGASNRYYKVARFPTRNIKTPIVLLYGGSDSLVDIRVMLKELPKHTIAHKIEHFEHLDFLWAQDIDKLVFPHVLEALRYYSMVERHANGMVKGLALTMGDRHRGLNRDNSGTSSWSEDENGYSDCDGANERLLTPTSRGKSWAQQTRDREYANRPYTPSSPLTAGWTEAREGSIETPVHQSNEETFAEQGVVTLPSGDASAVNGDVEEDAQSSSEIGSARSKGSDSRPIIARFGSKGITLASPKPSLGRTQDEWVG
jgi:lysosomal acid lipase/cholesteryl ester hydrolase